MAEEFLSRCISAAHKANASRQFDVAINWCQQALHIAPELPEAWFNLGLAYAGQGTIQKAIDALLRAEVLAQDNADAQNSIGLYLMKLGASADALRCLQRAVALAPEFNLAYFNLGGLLAKIHQPAAAATAFQKAIELGLLLPDAYYHLGNSFLDLKQQSKALAAYEQAFALDAGYKNLLGFILNTRRQMCWWENDTHSLNEMRSMVEQGKQVCSPFDFLALVDSLSQQRQVAELAVASDYPERSDLGLIPKRAQCAKIRIGYYSADFCEHPVAYLTVELFERHDKSRFELFGLAFGNESQGETRKRIQSAFDKFIDVHDMSDKQVASLSRSLNIDIAVDLGGFTKNARPGIFAFRAAPIQVSYIGYLGTMGAPYMDYLLADQMLVPEGSQKFYSEKIVYLPSYQANDSKRPVSDRTYTREELGLPNSGFVFCCFNNNYKITPQTFDGWMRILKKVENGILFLYGDNSDAIRNLGKEAELRGVSSDRLVFGHRLPRPEYLARYRAADLFLDTHPYNAGTTASDALWMGLPVLTRIGESFASRVAASLLTAIGLPELITTTQEEYEERAVFLATNPEQIAKIKGKLAQNRLCQPLFDTPRFTRHIESAYVAMYESYQANQPYENINIESHV